IHVDGHYGATIVERNNRTGRFTSGTRSVSHPFGVPIHRTEIEQEHTCIAKARIETTVCIEAHHCGMDVIHRVLVRSSVHQLGSGGVDLSVLANGHSTEFVNSSYLPREHFVDGLEIIN